MTYPLTPRGTGDPLLDLVLDYGVACERVARHAALGEIEEAKAASVESTQLLAQIMDLRGRETNSTWASTGLLSDPGS